MQEYEDTAASAISNVVKFSHLIADSVLLNEMNHLKDTLIAYRRDQTTDSAQVVSSCVVVLTEHIQVSTNTMSGKSNTS